MFNKKDTEAHLVEDCENFWQNHTGHYDCLPVELAPAIRKMEIYRNLDI